MYFILGSESGGQPLSINLLQLRAFVLAMRESKLSAVALRMGISQPTVSFHLARLEEAVGEPIFYGDVRKFNQLTPFGQNLHRYAERIIAAEDGIYGLVEDTRELKQGHIRMGSTHTPGTYLLPGVFSTFWEYYPDIDVSLDISPSHVLLPKLLNSIIDFCCINHFPSSHPQVTASPLFEDELVAIIHPDHAAAQKPEICIEDFERFKVIMHEPGSITRRVMDSWFEEHRIQPNLLMEVSSTETMIKLVKSKLGIAVVSALSCQHDVQQGVLAARSLAQLGCNHRRVIYLVQRKDAELSSASRALVRVLEAACLGISMSVK